MFKIEYDKMIGAKLYTMTYDRLFFSVEGASHVANHLRNTLHADVYIISTVTGLTVDYYWAD